jgi:uncharacterized protein (TIGR03437 family)
MAILRFAFVAALAVLTAAGQTTAGWKLVWSDEFNAPAGTPPDPHNWNYDLGNNNGWGNGELESYTSSPNNVFQDGKGNLVIRAIRDATGNYTSARLQTGSPNANTRTTDLSWQYGRIEARMKLPFGKGVWPAFWMLGESFGTVGWPSCGELDIMENFGAGKNNASVNNGTAHGPGYSGGSGIGKAYTLPLGQKVADDFHVYAIEWSQDSVVWMVDGVQFHKVTPASLPAGRQWVFNAPFFILLNLAIGGPTTFLGTPDKTAPFPPQDMLIDYVRAYQPAPIAASTPVIDPGRVVNAASYLGAISPGSVATVYGSNFTDGATYQAAANPNFGTQLSGVAVTVDSTPAPVIFASPSQINFQVPWETVPGLAVNVKVTRDGADSQIETVTIAAPASPSFFLSEFTNGVAWMTGAGCEQTGCAATPGNEYQLWANGLGPKNGASQDGAPAVYNDSLTPLQVPGSPDSCQLTVGGQPARVDYCGAAPGLIIDQINFAYPSGVGSVTPYVDASLTINAVTGRFRLPAPAIK